MYEVTLNSDNFSLAEQNRFRQKAHELGGKRKNPPSGGFSWQLIYQFEDTAKGEELYQFSRTLRQKDEEE